jgi:hypothetical protein
LGIRDAEDLSEAETLKGERLGAIEDRFDKIQLEFPAQELAFEGLIIVGP